MIQISDSGQELQGTAQDKDDPLPMDHHWLQAGDYYPHHPACEESCGKPSVLALVEGQWRAYTE